MATVAERSLIELCTVPINAENRDWLEMDLYYSRFALKAIDCKGERRKRKRRQCGVTVIQLVLGRTRP